MHNSVHTHVLILHILNKSFSKAYEIYQTIIPDSIMIIVSFKKIPLNTFNRPFQSFEVSSTLATQELSQVNSNLFLIKIHLYTKLGPIHSP